MTSVMMINITLIPPTDRADGKSAKTCMDPPALGEAITVLWRTIETEQKRDEGGRGKLICMANGGSGSREEEIGRFRKVEKER